MNPNIERLYRMASAPSRMVLGLMSGTSLDGLDLALCRIQGSGTETQLELLKFHTIPYQPDEKQRIRELAFRPDAPLEKICSFHRWLASIHSRLILQSLAQWQVDPSEVDLVASHGQTLFHAPGNQSTPHTTFQAGDGDQLAVATGIITICDFRQKHIAAGGEGAPLAPYGDYLLFAEAEQDVLLLNIGGIANLSFIPAGQPFGQMTVGDTGPGNTLMNAYINRIDPNTDFDTDGEMASRGHVNDALLQTLLNDPYFHLPLPKTTGPEYFNLDFLQRALETSHSTGLAPGDIMATLNRLTAESILQQVQKLTSTHTRKIYISGGGVHNHTLMNPLRTEWQGSVAELPFSGDAKEAILFAVLANECVAGDPQALGKEGKNLPLVSMGKISLPG